jgi:chromosome segregation ATPase/WD40 repeat protein
MLAHIAKTVSDTVQKTTRARACERLKPSGTLALDKQTGAVRALGVVDERLLGACDDGGLRCWSTTSGALASQARAHAGAVTAMVTSKDGTRVTSASERGDAATRDARTGVVTMELENGVDAVALWCLGMLTSGELVGGDDVGRIFVWEDGERFPIWRFASTAESAPMPGKAKRLKPSEGPPDRVHAVSGWVHRSTGKEFVVSGNGHGILSLWTVRVGKPVAEFGPDDGGHRGAIHTVCDNEGVIVTGGADGRVLAWYVNEEGQLLGPPEELSVHGHHTGAVLCAASIRPGFVCTGGVDGRALVWDIKARAVLFECPGTKSAGAVRSLAFDGNGVLYVGCALSQISRWELPSDEFLSSRSRDELPLLTRNMSSENISQAVPHSVSAPTPKRDVAAEELSLADTIKTLDAVRKECERLRESDRSRASKVIGLEKELVTVHKSLANVGEENQRLRAKVDSMAPTPSVAPKDDEIEALRKKCDKMENIARKQKTKIEELKGELQSAESSRAEDQKRATDELEAANEKLAGLHKELEEALAGAQGEGLSVEDMMAAAEKALLSPEPATSEASQEMMRELHSVREELQLSKQDVASAEQTIAKLRTQHDVLTARAKEIEEQSQSLSQSQDAKVATLREDVTSLREKLGSKDAELDDLRKQLGEAKKRAEALDRERLELTAQCEETSRHHKDVDASNAEVTRMREKFENAVTKGKGFQEEGKKLRAELEAKHVELAQAQDVSTSMRARVTELMASLDAANEKVTDGLRLLAQKEEEVARSASTLKTVENAAKELNTAKAETAKLQQKFDNAVKKGKGYQSECGALTARLKERENALSASNASKAQVESQLAAAVAEIELVRSELETRLDDVQRNSTKDTEELNSLRERLHDAEARLRAAEDTKGSAIAEREGKISALEKQINESDANFERMRTELAARDEERDRLISQIKSSEAAQEELQKLRSSIESYETEMVSLKTAIDTAKTKFANAVKKGKGFQEDANKLRDELAAKDAELAHARGESASVDTHRAELAASLDAANAKISDGLRLLAQKENEISGLAAELKAVQSRCTTLEEDISKRDAKKNDEIEQDVRGQRWLEEQARAAAESQVRDLAEENERLKQEVAAAAAAAQDAWQVAASHGVRPGDSRPVSEVGSPVREGYGHRARSLYQQPTYRGAMSMVHERNDMVVPREDYDRVKERCVKLKRDLEAAKQAAKEAVQQVINRLELEVMAKIHAESSAKAAEAECDRAWAHAKDALATAREMQKQPARQLAVAEASSVKPQPPPGTRAAVAMERQNGNGVVVIRQEHLASIVAALLSFIIGTWFAKF